MYTNYYTSSKLLHGAVSQLMGTRLDVLLFGEKPEALETLLYRIEAEIRRLERLMSRFDAESALSQVNRNSVIYPVGTTEELWDILQDCRRYYALTDGCFDITRGHFDQVEFDDVHKTIFLHGQANFDLGGYGKGYALKQVRKLLEKAATTRALINFGDSSVLALGAHPHGDCWPVGIIDPYMQTPVDTLQLRDCSLSVSGNTPSRPQHIVQPATGSCVTGRRMVAVVADDPTDAEVLTTALITAEEKQVETIVNRFKVKEYKIYG